MKNLFLLLFKLAYRFKENIYFFYNLLARFVIFLNKLHSSNPTLFALLKSAATALGGLIAYNLSAIAIKYGLRLDFVLISTWIGIFINLTSLGYLISLTKSFEEFKITTSDFTKQIVRG